MKTYRVKELFDTIQGEGARAGARSVFLRFTGCNLWTGRDKDRLSAPGACGGWCDTDFVGGFSMSATDILERLDAVWAPSSSSSSRRWVVITGGEPALQLDEHLLAVLHDGGWSVALETNGTVPMALGSQTIDHLCVSPKIGGELVVDWASVAEVKVVLPGGRTSLDAGWSSDALDAFAAQAPPQARLYVQPQWGVHAAVRLCLEQVRRDPRWRVSIQGHKILEVP